MKLRPATQAYDQAAEAQRIRQIEAADGENVKKDRDNDMVGRIILTSPNGTRYAIEVDNAGALSTSAV